MRRLPPLSSLKAFEAAARHRNFTRAAAELYVTQAAISHQVKQLEEWLGLKLFERRGHALALTLDGASYLPEVADALDRLTAATERLTSNSAAGTLRITVLPSFAAKWLMPHLSRFHAAHPEIELDLVSIEESWDFSNQQFDLGIRLGNGRWNGLQADLIAEEWLTPMYSPALAQRAPLQTPADLRRHPLLHDTPRDSWPRWLELVDAPAVDVRKGASFTDSSLALQAAADGHGVLLGRLFLAAGDIAAGRLLAPFPQRLKNDYAYWLVYPKASAQNPRIAAFRSWLLGEAELAAVALMKA
ncbi:LysR family glycine cleavage system transcriptional activator [Collimonas sp. PA-H2]|uniref:transcriptional regulator GcvA n=1 Tax=Collimonas sp. PA-H2 TaxID=1881062 RepID=UPI000BFA82AD|nr:transcriptional regulator GcvA [Collimonas sp. PA-H2]PFH11255.1 LysR family glycine cleavage system transcriptional activator [Collimonas sp. PA-H2]